MKTTSTTVRLSPNQLDNLQSILVVDTIIQGQYPYYELREWLDSYAGKCNWDWYYDSQCRLNITFNDGKTAMLFKLIWV